MTYHDEDQTSDAAGLDDRELPDPSDMDDDDGDGGDDTVSCPHCRESIYEGAERCPRCGRYVSEDDAPRRYPFWIVAAVVVLLAVIVLTWVL